jgi:hypothetical protein
MVLMMKSKLIERFGSLGWLSGSTKGSGKLLLLLCFWLSKVDWKVVVFINAGKVNKAELYLFPT